MEKKEEKKIRIGNKYFPLSLVRNVGRVHFPTLRTDKNFPENVKFRFDGFVNSCTHPLLPIHMYGRYICTSPHRQSSRGKFRSPDSCGDGGDCRRITNVDDSPAVVRDGPNARLLFNSPPTCGRTERISRCDGRRCRVLKFKVFYQRHSTGRRMQG